MTTMLERAARAAAAEMQKVEMIDAAPSVIAALQSRRVARAVLMAVREPSNGVVNAGRDDFESHNMVAAYFPESVFTAMIDFVLNEKPDVLSDV